MRVPELIIEEQECSETYQDQRPGTSGLRKRVETFSNGTYLQNFVQAIIDCIPDDPGSRQRPIIVSGDGRFFNKEASQIIIAMLAANGFSHVVVGINFLLSTPAVSTIIRKIHAIGAPSIIISFQSRIDCHYCLVSGGIILTASHNPGGPDGDFGVKFNVSNGGAAPDSLTEKIFERSKTLKSFKITKGFPIVDASKVGEFDFGGIKVEVVDGPSIHLSLLKTIFDFDAIKKFLHRTGFQILYDGMSGVAGPTALKLFIDEFGLPESFVTRAQPLPDFGGAHPDPNLTYAPELVSRMGLGPSPSTASIPDFGAANDGDMDRNMILGKQFFVTPSDSLAVIASHACLAIPYYMSNPLKGVARSMPTSCAVDRVAAQLGLPVYEVPTGWKYFCNLMDSGAIGICGEESFGTGSDHIREKDGMWAVLAWLSIMEYNNRNGRASVADVVQRHWRQYGRNYYCRYDYEAVSSSDADRVFALLRRHIAKNHSEQFAPFTLSVADEFRYVDPVDGSVADKQGVRFIFSDGSRIIYRLSGTGSVGATIRIYIERYENRPEFVFEDPSVALQPLIKIALSLSDIAQLTGRPAPTVIT